MSDKCCTLSKYAALPVQGIDLFQETLHLRKIIPTDCTNIDELLEGGLFTQELTEVFGPPGVGKTQMALTLTTSVISKLEANVVYFDTAGSFRAERLVQIIRANIDSFSQQILKSILSRVHCCKLFNVFDMLGELEMLKEKLSLEHDSFCLNLKLIVVDSINSIITPILGGKKQHGHTLMSRLGHLLKEIAYQFGIAVFIINSAVGHFDKSNYSTSEKFKPSLGKTWLSVPHVRLFLNFSKRQNEERIMKVLKHPRLPNKIATIVFVGKTGLSSERNTNSENDFEEEI